jgi:hypothetical protein
MLATRMVSMVGAGPDELDSAIRYLDQRILSVVCRQNRQVSGLIRFYLVYTIQTITDLVNFLFDLLLSHFSKN